MIFNLIESEETSIRVARRYATLETGLESNSPALKGKERFEMYGTQENDYAEIIKSLR